MEKELKSFDASANIEDAEQGIVHAVVSVFGNEDYAGDIVQKGAFSSTITKAKSTGKYPNGVFMHDMSAPVAKTLDMYEAEDGLHVIGKFNLETQRGRETFSDIKHGIINEYSFAFVIPKGGAEHKDGKRHIKNLTMYEWSPVFLGCNPSTRTVSAKSEPHAGLTMEDHSEKVLAAVEEFVDRLERYKAKREEEGRDMSPLRKTQAKELAERLITLSLEDEPEVTEPETEPSVSKEDFAQLMAQTEALLAAN